PDDRSDCCPLLGVVPSDAVDRERDALERGRQALGLAERVVRRGAELIDPVNRLGDAGAHVRPLIAELSGAADNLLQGRIPLPASLRQRARVLLELQALEGSLDLRLLESLR